MKGENKLSVAIIIALVLVGISAILFPGSLIVSFFIVVTSAANFLGFDPNAGSVLGPAYMLSTTILFGVIHLIVLVKYSESTTGNSFYGYYTPTILLVCFWIVLLQGDIQLLSGKDYLTAVELFSSNTSYFGLLIRTATCYLTAGVVVSLIPLRKQ